jgi:hypothetical protein
MVKRKASGGGGATAATVAALPPPPAPKRTRSVSAAPGQQSVENVDVRVPDDVEWAFQGATVPVSVLLLGEGSQLKRVNCSMVAKVVNDSGVVQEDSVANISPSSLQLNQGTGSLKMHIAKEVTPVGLRGSRIRIRVDLKIGEGAAAKTLRGHSRSLVLCSGRIDCTEQPPDQWYKDEGGKQNSMVLSARVVAEPRGVPTAGVPLSLRLLYENKQVVPSQDILSIQPDSQLVTDEDGYAIVKFKVSEVSQRHQGQKFLLELLPNVASDPMATGIAPTSSNPFVVLSKRKNRRQMRQPSVAYSVPANAVRPFAKSEGGTSSADGQFVEGAPLQRLALSAHAILQSLEWQLVGYGIDLKGAADTRHPIRRCPMCLVSRDITTGDAPHATNCVLSRWLHEYNDRQRGIHLSSEDDGDGDAEDADGDDAEWENDGSAPSRLMAAPAQPPVPNTLDAIWNSRSSGESVRTIPIGGEQWAASLGTSLGPLLLTGLSSLGALDVSGGSLQQAAPEERAVGCVLNVEHGIGSSGASGFPAFTAEGHLVGFYQDQVTNDLSHVSFLPLHMASGLSVEEIEHLEERSRAALNGVEHSSSKEGVETVWTLASEGDIGQLREKAFINKWMQQPQFGETI